MGPSRPRLECSEHAGRYLDIQQLACEWLVRLHPADNEMLLKLGTVQLARYMRFSTQAADSAKGIHLQKRAPGPRRSRHTFRTRVKSTWLEPK